MMHPNHFLVSLCLFGCASTTPSDDTPEEETPAVIEDTTSENEEPVYTSEVLNLPSELRDAMVGVTWNHDCPVHITELRLLRFSHWTFEDEVQEGSLVVAAEDASVIDGAMRAAFETKFPLESARPASDFGGDDDASMAANNTSAFNCRKVTGGDSYSQHSYGNAVDINPVQNPYVQGTTVLPEAGKDYLIRDPSTPGLLVEDSPIVQHSLLQAGAGAVSGPASKTTNISQNQDSKPMKPSLLLALAALPLSVACGTKPPPDDTGSPSAVDRDGDGYTSDVDCDDTNPDVYPEAPEICDDLDNDCDAEVDETGTLSYVDADQDGYGDPATEQLICEEDPSRVSNGDDCDDSDPLVNPDAEEICDGIDNDCDSETDAEGLASFTDPNGAVADYSSFVVGSSGSPASLTLSGGRLAVCEGTYFLNIEATGPVEIVGHASESGEVILDAGGVNNVITSVESFVDLNVSGVTLTGGIGWVDPWGDRAGGAMSVHTDGGSGSVVLSDVVISGSSATTGGGLFVWGADTTLTDVEIVGNTATSWTGGALIADGAATLTRVTIHENHGGYTGGITVFGSTVMNLAQFEDVTLLDNTSDWGASAMFLGSNILDWTASTPGASAVLGNTDLQPSSMYSSAVELSVPQR